VRRYLGWFGEIGKNTPVLNTLIDGIQWCLDSFKKLCDYMIDQLYLATASGQWLDRWGWSLARLRRMSGENDNAFRARILLFRERCTRKAIREIIKTLIGRYPVELYQPVRDSAYWNTGFFYTLRTDQDVSAAEDGTGQYVARLGTKQDTSFEGIVRVRLPAAERLGQGTAFWSAGYYLDAGAYISSLNTAIYKVRKNDVLDIIRRVQVCGTRILVEFIER